MCRPDFIVLDIGLPGMSGYEVAGRIRREPGLEDMRIIAVADTAQSLFHMGTYRGSSGRLIAVAWSAESLRADIGVETDRDRLGEALGPYRLARELALLAATSARVAAIDTAFLNIRDMEGLRAEALAARRDGFTGKIALDLAQVGVINDVFPSRSVPLAKGRPS